jgi:hypothetical protein
MKENTNGQMDQCLTVIGNIIKFQDTEFIFGMMGEDTRETGKTIRWTEKGYILGWTGGSITELMRMIRSRVMASIHGLIICYSG